jgi:hypothetical protein
MFTEAQGVEVRKNFEALLGCATAVIESKGSTLFGKDE